MLQKKGRFHKVVQEALWGLEWTWEGSKVLTSPLHCDDEASARRGSVTPCSGSGRAQMVGAGRINSED